MIWHLLHERNDLSQKLAIATMPRRTRKARDEGGRNEEGASQAQAPQTFLTGDQPPAEEADKLDREAQAVDPNAEKR